MGDFNSEINETCMQSFCKPYGWKSLIKEPTHFKNPENPSCIDLIMTNNLSKLSAFVRIRDWSIRLS